MRNQTQQAEFAGSRLESTQFMHFGSWVASKVKKFMRDQKGILGLNTVQAFMMTLFGLILMAFAVIVAIANLKTTTVLPTNSEDYNLTQSIFRNFTISIGVFFGNIPGIMGILSVVVLVSAVLLIVVAVRTRFGTMGDGSMGSITA